MNNNITLLDRTFTSKSKSDRLEYVKHMRDRQAINLMDRLVEDFSLCEGFTLDDIRHEYNPLTRRGPVNTRGEFSTVRYGKKHLEILETMNLIEKKGNLYFINLSENSYYDGVDENDYFEEEENFDGLDNYQIRCRKELDFN